MSRASRDGVQLVGVFLVVPDVELVELAIDGHLAELGVHAHSLPVGVRERDQHGPEFTRGPLDGRELFRGDRTRPSSITAMRTGSLLTLPNGTGSSLRALSTTFSWASQ